MIMIDIDMPDNCDECRFNTEYDFCKAMPDNFCGNTDSRKRPEWCPLKEQEVASAHWADDTGHWIEGDRDGIDPHTRTTGEMIDTFRCSWCGFYQYWKTPFCPNCGAKIEGL